MTDTDLATLLRRDVAATEPHHHLDARVPVHLGRRRLRSRRLRAAGVAATVVAVAGVAVPFATAGRHEAAPAAHESTADHVRGLLEPSTGELATPTVAEGPTSTTLVFGNRHDGVWHGYRVTSALAPGPEDPADHCREAMERGYVSCSVESLPAGGTAVVEVLAVTPVGQVPADNAELGPVGDNIFARVPLSRLDTVDPRDRIFRREVVVATAAGTVSVDEQVNVPDPSAAEAAYVVPVHTLLEIAGDLATHPGLFGAH